MKSFREKSLFINTKKVETTAECENESCNVTAVNQALADEESQMLLNNNNIFFYFLSLYRKSTKSERPSNTEDTDLCFSEGDSPPTKTQSSLSLFKHLGNKTCQMCPTGSHAWIKKLNI